VPRGKFDLSRLLVVVQAALEVEAFVFLLHDFHAGDFWRVFLPLATHCLATALLAFGFVRRWDFRRPSDRAWAVVGMCMTLPLPLFGYLGFVVLFAMSETGSRNRGELLRDFQEYIAYDPSILADTARRAKADDQFVFQEVDVSPLRDILSGGDIALKRGAILSLARVPRREAVDLLKGALTDESREIRYYASTALSDMEREFNDRIFRLVREVERAPTAVERHVDLACTVLDYSETGLLDEGMVRYFLEVGLRALDKAVLVAPQDARVAFHAGRTHHRLGDLPAAEASLLRLQDLAPDDLQAGILLAQVEFELGRKDAVHALLKTLRARHPDDPHVLDLAHVLVPEAGTP